LTQKNNFLPPEGEDEGGGLVFPMMGAHTLDYSLWLFDDRKPVSVFAKAYSNNPSFEGDDQGTVIIEMEDGSFIKNTC
jgi:predicted dehydrogenase